MEVNTRQSAAGATLVADGGATSVKWGCGSLRFATAGLNAATAGSEALAERPEGLPEGLAPARVFYYGAGVLPAYAPGVEAWLRSLFPTATEVHAASDLEGAALGMLGRNRGVVAILGTGSASCLWDGRAIARQVPSLGYLLGDEGSGAHLGRTLLADALKGALPQPTAAKFLADTGLDVTGAIELAYRTATPARNLASLARWLSDNIELAGVGELVERCMAMFVERNLAPYGADRFSAVGSVALAFRPQLEAAAARCGMKIDAVEASPLDQLIALHGLA